jgi:hypothetical protein
LGNESLHKNTTGEKNSATGYAALYNNTTGINNTATGASALEVNTTGISNTASGAYALAGNTTGDDNTALGVEAGVSNTTGINNTFIGRFANASAVDLSNATALGNTAVVNASDKVRLGNAAITVVEGQVAYTFPSDGRFKNNIQEDVKGLDFIMKLRPVTYNFNRVSYSKYIGEKQTVDYVQTLNRLSTARQTGFIAQEMEKAVNASGYTGFDAVTVPQGEHQTYGIAYATLVVPLVKAVQEQQAKIEAQEKHASTYQEQIQQLKKEIEALKRLVTEKSATGN